LDAAQLSEILALHVRWLVGDRSGVRADLRGSNLRGSDLRGCNLRGSDLRGCNLRSSNLRGCNLSGSDLRGSNLCGCNLRDSDLRGCDLRGCDLRDCNLSDAILDPIMSARLSIVPEAGAFTGHKKLREGRIATLEIPPDAARSNAAGRKCRASKARVIAVIGPDGEACEEGRSLNDQAFVYRVGQVVSPHEWCEDRWQECAGGIHFYITMEEAKAHA
jgi:hypothetical protein